MIAAGLLALAALGGAIHPNSLSSSYLSVAGHVAHHRLRCQVLSVLEVLPAMDRNGDQVLSASELQLGRGALEAYINEHYLLQTEDGARLTATLLRAAPSPSVDDPLDPFRTMHWIDVDLDWQCNTEIHGLDIRVTMFRATSPDHIDLCTIEGANRQSTVFVLDPDFELAQWRDQADGGSLSFFALGWWHILSGWDHLAFLAALLLSTRGLKPLLWVVTAFTLAHSITLALVVLDVIRVAAIAHYIEPLIALSIAFVAADNLLHLNRPRTRALESLVFGLVHGLGFAGFLQESLLATSSRVPALALFNLGVEAGQLAVVAVAAALLHATTRRTPGSAETCLAPQKLRLIGSIALVALGLTLFFDRVP